MDPGFDEVFGLSVQLTDYQREARDQLEPPFKLLSDSSLEFTESLELPPFEVEGVTLLKRNVRRVKRPDQARVLPDLPAGEHAEEVAEWADAHLER